MTVSSYTKDETRLGVSRYSKAFKQLDHKPIKKQKFLKHSSPIKRSCGITNKKCRVCGKSRAHMSQYGLHFCRQCFREVAKNIGFKQYS